MQTPHQERRVDVQRILPSLLSIFYFPALNFLHARHKRHQTPSTQKR